VSGDSVHAVLSLSDLTERVRRVSSTRTRLTALRDRVSTELGAKQQEITDLEAREGRLLKVGELFRALMDQLVVDQMRSIESIVTEGLQAIFPDQNLRFEAQVSTKYNKISIEFFIVQQGDRVEIRDNPLEAFGGGPSSVASLILRILTLLRLRRSPFLFLDETLGAVSEEYIEGAGQFLHKLAARSDLDVLLVTQQRSYATYAQVAYQATQTVHDEARCLFIRLARGSHAE
jgi:DNA repair exonuclease SbcCD ATPase subunit